MAGSKKKSTNIVRMYKDVTKEIIMSDNNQIKEESSMMEFES